MSSQTRLDARPTLAPQPASEPVRCFLSELTFQGGLLGMAWGNQVGEWMDFDGTFVRGPLLQKKLDAEIIRNQVQEAQQQSELDKAYKTLEENRLKHENEMGVKLMRAEEARFTIKAEAAAQVKIAEEQIRAAKESRAKDQAHVTELAEENIRTAGKEVEAVDILVEILWMQKAEVTEAATKLVEAIAREIEAKSETIRRQQEPELEAQKRRQKLKQKDKERYSVSPLLTYICREKVYEAEMTDTFLRHMKSSPEFCKDPENLELCLRVSRIFQLSHDSDADYGALDRFANAGTLQIRFTSSLLEGYLSAAPPEQRSPPSSVSDPSERMSDTSGLMESLRQLDSARDHLAIVEPPNVLDRLHVEPELPSHSMSNFVPLREPPRAPPPAALILRPYARKDKRDR